MKSIKVRNFEKRDQDRAYQIWKNGMTEDVGELFIEYFMAKSQVKIVLIVIFILPFFTASSYWKFIGIIIDSAIVGIIHFYAYWIGRDYVDSRTDMLTIQQSWKDTFLVADLYEDNQYVGVCGTISYKSRVSGKSFNGNSLDNKIWEIYSLSTDKRARGLSVAKKLVAEVEKRAHDDDCDVILETWTALYPAVRLYGKLNYELSEVQSKKETFLEKIMQFILPIYITVCLKKL